jgi:hypothetical protein
MKPRKCIVYKKTDQKEFLFTGILLEFGLESTEGGSYSVGIVEDQKGRLCMVYPECIRMNSSEFYVKWQNNETGRIIEMLNVVPMDEDKYTRVPLVPP